MFSTAEKSVTFLANLVTIFGFVAAVIGWLGGFSLPDYTPPSIVVSKVLLALFGIISSYGIASFIRFRIDSGMSIVAAILLVAVFTVVYAFAEAYLIAMFSAGRGAQDKQSLLEVGALTAWGSYVLFSLILVGWRIMYPKGFNFVQFFVRPRYPSSWGGILIALIPFIAMPLLVGDFVRSFQQ